MNKRATSLKKSSVSLFDPNLFFGLTSNYCGGGMFRKAAGHNSTHSCTFPQQFLSWLQYLVYNIHAAIILVYHDEPEIP